METAKIEEGAALYYLTFTVVYWLPVFVAAEPLSRTVTAVRQYTGRQLANYCHEKMPAVYGQVIGLPRRKDRTNQFWQQGKHPVAIWSEGFWRTKIDYLHDNPRRKGLVHEVACGHRQKMN